MYILNFDTREEAEKNHSAFIDIAMKYGFLRVSDIYNVFKVSYNNPDSDRLGWGVIEVMSAPIKKTLSHGVVWFGIELPEPINIEVIDRIMNDIRGSLGFKPVTTDKKEESPAPRKDDAIEQHDYDVSEYPVDQFILSLNMSNCGVEDIEKIKSFVTFMLEKYSDRIAGISIY